jgi:hypothetical protein
MKFLNLFLLLWVIFALDLDTDPDPLTPLTRIQSGSATLEKFRFFLLLDSGG